MLRVLKEVLGRWAFSNERGTYLQFPDPHGRIGALGLNRDSSVLLGWYGFARFNTQGSPLTVGVVLKYKQGLVHPPPSWGGVALVFKRRAG